MTVLLTTRAAPLLPPGRDEAGWHAAVSAEVAEHLTSAHAALLARPERAATGTEWAVPDADWRRSADLPPADRDKLLAAVAAIRSDIRRLAESGAAPAVAAAWPALWTVPDMSYLFAVAGRPVLAGWALPAPGGRLGTTLDRYDDGVAWRRPPRTPWTAYGATLGVLALLFLSGGLLLPFLGVNWSTPPAMCTAQPGQLALLAEQGKEASRGAQLQTLLAGLTDQLGRQQLMCPVPGIQSPPPARAPGPAPHADLPQDRWERRDVTMLEGCWSLITQLAAINSEGGADPFTSWKMCFGRDGGGQQTMVTQGGRNCRGPLVASFSAEQLQIATPQRCEGSLHMHAAELSCRRVGDAKAQCTGRNLASTGQTPATFDATFQR